jgi:hypothetical protein
MHVGGHRISQSRVGSEVQHNLLMLHLVGEIISLVHHRNCDALCLAARIEGPRQLAFKPPGIPRSPLENRIAWRGRCGGFGDKVDEAARAGDSVHDGRGSLDGFEPIHDPEIHES